ncbi:unnamed protein product [Adineta ricciae]|uniref:Uncharacterized protein n=1 Tax=Adineta ricciae TaxID=249248 RepID=A0A815LBI5_ADIRI|nr:unnamed protein product [Adineta ricciae]
MASVDSNVTKCATVSVMWYYPRDNLTLTIETCFTKKQRPYGIEIDNDELLKGIPHVYRILGGQETEITTTAKSIIQKSDNNFQVVLKLQGPPPKQTGFSKNASPRSKSVLYTLKTAFLPCKEHFLIVETRFSKTLSAWDSQVYKYDE